MSHDHGDAPTRETPPLFEFLFVLAVALARGKLSRHQAAIAIFVALSTKGTTGENGTIDVQRLELELGLKERQIWRHFKLLRDGGWLAQTAKPTRGYNGQGGRRARYRLTLPLLSMTDESDSDRVSSSGAETTDEEPAIIESSGVFASNRLAFSEESSVAPERESGTVPPSDGPTTDETPGLGTSTAAPTGQARELEAVAPDSSADRDSAALADGGRSRVSVRDRVDHLRLRKAAGQ